MDTFYFFEEELASEIQLALAQRFNLDGLLASELANEVVEILMTKNNALTHH